MPHGRLVEPRLRRLGVEPLESRRLLSVFFVENLDDSGDANDNTDDAADGQPDPALPAPVIEPDRRFVADRVERDARLPAAVDDLDGLRAEDQLL